MPNLTQTVKTICAMCGAITKTGVVISILKDDSLSSCIFFCSGVCLIDSYDEYIISKKG